MFIQLYCKVTYDPCSDLISLDVTLGVIIMGCLLRGWQTVHSLTVLFPSAHWMVKLHGHTTTEVQAAGYISRILDLEFRRPWFRFSPGFSCMNFCFFLSKTGVHLSNNKHLLSSIAFRPCGWCQGPKLLPCFSRNGDGEINSYMNKKYDRKWNSRHQAVLSVVSLSRKNVTGSIMRQVV